jgi:hypothetical protein
MSNITKNRYSVISQLPVMSKTKLITSLVLGLAFSTVAYSEEKPQTTAITMSGTIRLENDVIVKIEDNGSCTGEFANEGEAFIKEEFLNQGYGDKFTMSMSIPVKRLKNPDDAWRIEGDRAVTMKGCWKWEDAANNKARLKMQRKKDLKLIEQDLSLALKKGYSDVESATLQELQPPNNNAAKKSLCSGDAKPHLF